MRIAWISPYVPAPATSGGVIRQTRLAAALAAQSEVHLFARGEPWERLAARGEPWGRRDARGGVGGPFASAWIGRDYWPRGAEEGASRRVRRGSPASLYRAVAALHQRAPLDLVVVAHSWAALGARELGVPWLLDEH